MYTYVFQKLSKIFASFPVLILIHLADTICDFIDRLQLFTTIITPFTQLPFSRTVKRASLDDTNHAGYKQNQREGHKISLMHILLKCHPNFTNMLRT